MAVVRSVIRGLGAYLPQRVVTNDELAMRLDTSDAWIRERTGIRQRHVAADGELTSDLGTAACRQALVRAKVDPADIDLIVCATSTPDQTFPATATAIQAKLGAKPGGAAFDIQAVCSGFVYGLAVADGLLRTGPYNHALVVGAETFSRIIDPDDRTTAVLFGDGAGAVVLEAQSQHGTTEDRGILTARLHADGRHADKLYVDGGPSSTGTVGHLRMNGREVFRHAVTNIAGVIQETLVEMEIAADEIDWFVPHQANERILDGTANRIGIPYDKIIVTVDRHANTSAASIPLALNVALEDGRLREGDLVMMEAMGGGFTWGSVLARW